MYIDDHAQRQLIGAPDEWGYVPITQPVMTRVNQLLSTTHIQQLFHDAARAYEAIHRWDVFRHFRDRIPKIAEPIRDAEFILPAQLDGGDWRYMREISGRWPKYWDYCLSRACHWTSIPWLAVAKSLFPEHQWDILSSPLHTGIICVDEKVVFDPYFYAVSVPISNALSMWNNEADGVYEANEYFVNGDGYSMLDGSAEYAARFWHLAETFEGTEGELIQIMNDFIDKEQQQEELGIESSYCLTDNDHFNQDPETLLVLASRADQYARN